MSLTGSATNPTERDVEVWSRSGFLDYFGQNYAPGQHVTIIGPTQRGKTYISHQMLARVVRPQLPALVLAGKPPKRDATMTAAPDKLGLQVTETFPPPPVTRARGWVRKKVSDSPRTNGYLLRPHQSLDDLDRDEDNLRVQFRNALQYAYAGKMGKVIVDADEGPLLYDLGLKKNHEAILTRGAPDVAIWTLMQRGRNMSYYSYNMPEHVLFLQDPDLPNVRRYAEMVGGVDPVLVRDAMQSLETRTDPVTQMTNSEVLYYRRSGSRLAIVRMD